MHEQAQERMMRAFGEGAAIADDVLAHVRTCKTCGAFLDRLAGAERAFEHAAGLSARQLDVMEERVLGQQSLGRRFGKFRLPLLALPLFASAAASVLFIARPVDDDGWRARGVDHAAAHAESLRLLCVGQSGVHGDVETGTDEATLRCGTHDSLAFGVTVDATSPARYVFIVGRTASGAARWYHPHPREAHSVALPQAPLTRHPLAAIRLEVNHQPGPHEVYAIFSETPISVEKVERALASGSLDDLTGPGIIVQRAGIVLE